MRARHTALSADFPTVSNALQHEPSWVERQWDILSEPTVSHVCTFPYNQGTITQRMYITSGEQALIRLDPDHTQWGEIQLSFVAMSPRRRPK